MYYECSCCCWTEMGRALLFYCKQRVMCKVTLFFSKRKEKTQAAGPNSLGAILSLRTRVRDPASSSVFSSFFSCSFAFFLKTFFHCLLNCWCILLKWDVMIPALVWNCTARHNSALPLQVQVWGCVVVQAWARVHVSCARKKTMSAWSEYSLCEPLIYLWTWVRAPARASTRASLCLFFRGVFVFFWSPFLFLRSLLLCILHKMCM